MSILKEFDNCRHNRARSMKCECGSSSGLMFHGIRLLEKISHGNLKFSPDIL